MIKRISVPLVGLLFVVCAFGRDEYTRTFDKTLAMQAGQKLSVEHRFGDITIRTHAEPELQIHATIKVSAPDAGQAKMFADKVEILAQPGTAELVIRTRYPGEPMSSGWFGNVSYMVHYELTVPESASLEVRNAFGSVSVSGVRANAAITTSHGSIDFRDGQGTQRLEDSFASIHVAHNLGDVSIDASNGSVTAEDINGALSVRNRFASVTTARISKGVTILNANGTVKVTDCGGIGNIKNSFGSVIVQGFQGDLTVDSSYGSVKASNLQGAQVRASFGPVVLDGVAGPVRVTDQNGPVDATTVVRSGCQPIIIRTSFSGVRVHLAGEVSYHVTARTSFGHIRTDFPLSVSGSLSSDSVSGEIGSGHCEMTLTNSYGPIEILKAGS